MESVLKPLLVRGFKFPRSNYNWLNLTWWNVCMKALGSVLTCCAKRRSSSGTGGCSCCQDTPGPGRNPRWCSLWRTGRSGTVQERGERWEGGWIQMCGLAHLIDVFTGSLLGLGLSKFIQCAQENFLQTSKESAYCLKTIPIHRNTM